MAAKRPQDWTAEEKLQAVIEAAGLPEAELGEFLRRQGLHEAQLQQWRDGVLAGLEQHPKRGSKKSSPEARRVRELERELARKEKALAEAAALLILKKNHRGPVGATCGGRNSVRGVTIYGHPREERPFAYWWYYPR